MINIKNSTEHGIQDRGVAVAIFFLKRLSYRGKKTELLLFGEKN